MQFQVKEAKIVSFDFILRRFENTFYFQQHVKGESTSAGNFLNLKIWNQMSGFPETKSLQAGLVSFSNSCFRLLKLTKIFVKYYVKT